MEEQNQTFTYNETTPWLNAELNPESNNAFTRWLYPQIAESGEFQRENYLMDKGNAFNEYMFNKTNEWNSASAQMQRGIEAGINPMLLAAGISGSGASATPMQSQSAGVGMNSNTANPIDTANSLMSTLESGGRFTDQLGKLLGFGKENRLNNNIAKQTARKLASETDLNKHQLNRLQKTFDAFIEEMQANSKNAKKQFEVLEETIKKYKEEQELLKKQQNLVTEQENTQKQETQLKQREVWKADFEKQIRDMFGFQPNGSDISMLAELILNGHGEQVIDAIRECLSSVFNGIQKNVQETIPILGKKGPGPIKYAKEQTKDIKKNFKRANIHTYYCNQWDRMTNQEKNEWRKKGYDKWSYANTMTDNEIRGASGKW